MDNLSFDTVIIVACVCGGVVLILTVVLIVLCCQRRRSKDLYEKTETNVIEPAITSAETNFTSDGHNEEQRSDESLSSHQPQRHKDDPKRSAGELVKEFEAGHKSSNPTLVGNTSYPSLNHISGGGGGSSSALQVSAASSADDKRPRKVIYEVIV